MELNKHYKQGKLDPNGKFKLISVYLEGVISLEEAAFVRDMIKYNHRMGIKAGNAKDDAYKYADYLCMVKHGCSLQEFRNKLNEKEENEKNRNIAPEVQSLYNHDKTKTIDTFEVTPIKVKEEFENKSPQEFVQTITQTQPGPQQTPRHWTQLSKAKKMCVNSGLKDEPCSNCGLCDSGNIPTKAPMPPESKLGNINNIGAKSCSRPTNPPRQDNTNNLDTE